MVKEYKKVTEPSSIGSTFEPDLVNRLNDYSKLIEVDRTKIVSNLIEEALEGKVLNNDFIELDDFYYFDLIKLIKEGRIEATREEPIINNVGHIHQMLKVPNNLDKPNKKYGTYSISEDKPSKHKGILYYADVLGHIVKNDGKIYFDCNIDYDGEIFECYFLFEYDDQEAEKIIIHKVEEENIKYLVDTSDYGDVMADVQKQKQELKDILVNGEVDLQKLFDMTLNIICSSKLFKEFEFSRLNAETYKLN